MERGTRSRRPRGVQRLVLFGAVALFVAGCMAGPAPTPLGPDELPGPSNPELATGTARQGDLALSVTAEPAVVAVGETIGVTATISNKGEDPLVVSGRSYRRDVCKRRCVAHQLAGMRKRRTLRRSSGYRRSTPRWKPTMP